MFAASDACFYNFSKPDFEGGKPLEFMRVLPREADAGQHDAFVPSVVLSHSLL